MCGGGGDVVVVGSTSVSHHLRDHNERLGHRDRRAPFERRRPAPLLQRQRLHHLHEGGSRQVALPISYNPDTSYRFPSPQNVYVCKSHDTHTKKSLSLHSYRITVGNKTCVFEKERDPTVLRSPSAGKLLQYTVEDGGHVTAGYPYAEIEVI